MLRILANLYDAGVYYILLSVLFGACTSRKNVHPLTVALFFRYLKVHEKTGIELSESLSMMPASSVSALVFAHKESSYFAVGQVAKDQVQDYAQRKGMDLETMERWLSPILSYERS